MIIYDVVQRVDSTGARITSHRPGRHLVGFRDRAGDAYQLAEHCNRCCLVPGIRYAVEAHAESCPGRAYPTRDGDNEAVCTCTKEKSGI